jgi:hypothetical protein
MHMIENNMTFWAKLGVYPLLWYVYSFRRKYELNVKLDEGEGLIMNYFFVGKKIREDEDFLKQNFDSFPGFSVYGAPQNSAQGERYHYHA